MKRLAESDDVWLPMRLIGLAVVTFSLILAPLVALAQQPPGKTVRIGSLFFVTSPFLDEEFRQGLRELGYVEGRSIAIEYRCGSAIACYFSDRFAPEIPDEARIRGEEDRRPQKSR